MSETPILFVNVPDLFRERLTDVLDREMATQCLWAASNEEAIAILRAQRPAALVTCLVKHPSDTDAIRIAHLLYPDLPLAFLASTISRDCFAALLAYGASAAIPPDVTLQPDQLRLFLQHLTETSAEPGLARFFKPGQTILSRRLEERGMREQLWEMIAADLHPIAPVESNELQLVFEEILNNALYHAFIGGRGKPKYSGENKRLDDADEIRIEWALCRDANGDPDTGAMSISDNQGLLAPHMAWDRLLRQTSNEGVLDTNGRGLYLVHLVSCLMLVTVWPGLRTEISVFFSRNSDKNEKPVGIRIHSPKLITNGK